MRSRSGSDSTAFIGFGEAAMAFVQGWGGDRPFAVTAFDIKTDAPAAEVREAKQADYRRHAVDGCPTAAAALAGKAFVISVVTADQAFTAAAGAAAALAPGALYLDCNSCAPQTKERAAALIDGAGGRYVDVAVMAPVHPRLHRTPLLLSGAYAEAALAELEKRGMNASIVPGAVGAASSIKMVRSIVIKGLEALTAECVLAGTRAGVDDYVLDSLEATFPGFGWKERAGYMLERVMTHGVRRAAEMREVAATVDQLGLDGGMARATVAWQQRIGELDLRAATGDYRELAAAILHELGPDDTQRTTT